MVQFNSFCIHSTNKTAIVVVAVAFLGTAHLQVVLEKEGALNQSLEVLENLISIQDFQLEGLQKVNNCHNFCIIEIFTKRKICIKITLTPLVNDRSIF